MTSSYLFEQEGAIVASSSNVLRAAQIDVYSITPRLHYATSCKHDSRIIATELYYQWFVIRAIDVSIQLSVISISHKDGAVDHGRVAQLCAVLSTQHPECLRRSMCVSNRGQ